MTINFRYFPAGTIRVPGFYAEFDPTLANAAQRNQRALIIGQMRSAGTATANVPVISSGVGDAETEFGIGSQIASMIAAYRKIDPFGEVWMLPVADAGGAVSATGTILVTGPATAAGTLFVYIAGVRVAVGVNSGDSASTIAAALNAAINAIASLPVTSAVSTATVTLTARNGGTLGNDIDIRCNYLGGQGGEAFPAGVGATITAMASGATDPTLTTALANLADMPFDFIIMPYSDTTSLNALQSFMDDVSGRWAWLYQIYGHVFTAHRGAFSGLAAFGTARNDQHCSIMPFYNSPSPVWQWAAEFGAWCTVSLRNNPVVPVAQLPMNVLAPPIASRFTISQRNTLLYDGMSTFVVSDSGRVTIERVVTTYQENASNQPDSSYLDVETMFTLMFVVRFMLASFASKLSAKILVSDQTRLSGQNPSVVTPAIIRAINIADYRFLEGSAYVQNGDAYAQNVVVENAGGGQVRILAPIALGNQLRQVAMLVQFTKP